MIAHNVFLTRRLIFTVGSGFALSLVLIVAMSVLGVRQLAHTNANLEAIVHDNSVKSRLATQMRDILRDRAISMLSIVVIGDAFERDEEMLRFYQYGSTYQSVRFQLEAKLTQPEEKRILARIDTLTRANRPVMVRVVDLGVEGYTFLAFDLLQKEGIPLQRQLVKELDELIRIQRNLTSQAAEEAHASYLQTRWLMILLGFLAVVAAVLVAGAVLRRSAHLAASTERERTKYLTLFETNSDGIVILDENGFTDCNPATLDMFRIERVEDFLAQQPADLGLPIQACGSPAADLAARHIQEAVEHGHATFDWIARRPDGSTFPAEIALHAMTLDGHPVIQAIIRDISTQKETAKALETARDAALEATELKSQFVANVSHEIRTPMNGILGMTRLLLGSPLNPRQLEYAEAISRSAEALMGIINDLLDFSKIEAGHLTLEKIDFDLHALLKDVRDLYLPRAEAKGLQLHMEIQGEPPRWVCGDPLRLRQVLLNLLDNAIKFTATGEVALQAVAEQDGWLHIHVRDSGIGIPQDVQAHIFEAFAQADGTVSRKFGGTGLGLAICRQLTGLMGSQITLQSEAARGSTFSFRVHLPPGQQPNRRLSDHIEARPLRFPETRVLVAEDNLVNQKLAGFMLEELGMEVLFADDGKAAYDLLAREKVDLVLMDCQMPEWDGLTATRAIREREREQDWPHLPILALSANAMPGFEATCREAGMDGYLDKPLDTAALVAALRHWLPAVPGNEEMHAFDHDKLRRLCRGDAQKLAEMLDLFLSSSEDLCEQLTQAMKSGDLALAARQAHQLKGACAYMGAQETCSEAAKLETAAKAGDALAAQSAQEDLEAALIRLFIPIREELAGLRGGQGS